MAINRNVPKCQLINRIEAIELGRKHAAIAAAHGVEVPAYKMVKGYDKRGEYFHLLFIAYTIKEDRKIRVNMHPFTGIGGGCDVDFALLGIPKPAEKKIR